MERIVIKTEYIKLDQFLKFTLIASSGGEAKMMIEDGLVFVNGKMVFERGRKLKKGDKIEVQDQQFVIA
jgi:ribosome-associated protein